MKAAEPEVKHREGLRLDLLLGSELAVVAELDEVLVRAEEGDQGVQARAQEDVERRVALEVLEQGLLGGRVEVLDVGGRAEFPAVVRVRELLHVDGLVRGELHHRRAQSEVEEVLVVLGALLLVLAVDELPELALDADQLRVALRRERIELRVGQGSLAQRLAEAVLFLCAPPYRLLRR